MIKAPERPTTPELHDAYDIDNQAALDIAQTRIDINAAIARPGNKFLLAGPCALTEDAETLQLENQEWRAFAQENGLVVAVRRHSWKPRSVKTWGEKLTRWHGLETGFEDADDNREAAALSAYEIMHEEAVSQHNVSMEIAFSSQVLRYGPMLSFAQIGARTREEYYDTYEEYLEFLDFLAKREAVLPLGIKNDTSGSITRAVEEVNRVNDIRASIGMSAAHRAVLIYRGGDNAKTPEAWEVGAIEAIEATHGAVILDVAHGGEQAFDFNGKYEKSEAGELACLGAAMQLKRRGLTFVGVSAESSILESPMDPAASPEAVRMLLKGANVLIPA
jgi:phospho-2-dehydro-3-deoxyheptonate aldolase